MILKIDNMKYRYDDGDDRVVDVAEISKTDDYVLEFYKAIRVVSGTFKTNCIDSLYNYFKSKKFKNTI